MRTASVRELVIMVPLVGCGMADGRPDEDPFRDGYEAEGSGSGSSTTSSSGGPAEPNVDVPPTTCPATPDDEECCVSACAPEVSPVPGQPSTFTCPVAGMPYNCGCPGTGLFDCDDFAEACEQWGRNQGHNICTYYFSWDAPGGPSGHAINIVEFEYDGPHVKYCFVEPQSNDVLGCWIQEAGEPDPPQWLRDQLCKQMGGTCRTFEVRCDEGHSERKAGEVCFNTLPAVCSQFRRETGLCPYTFEEDHDCHARDGSGDDCYWSCDDDEVCGYACDDCDPEPVQECEDIDGNNETCYWDCGAMACGNACFTCV